MNEISLQQWTEEKIEYHRRYGVPWRLPLSYLQRLLNGIKEYYPFGHNDLINHLKIAIDMKKQDMERERIRMVLSTQETSKRRLNWIQGILLIFWFIELGILFSLSYSKDHSRYQSIALKVCFCNCVGLAINIMFELIKPAQYGKDRGYFTLKPSISRKIIRSKLRQFMMLPFIAYTLAICLNLFQELEYKEYILSQRQKYIIYGLIPIYSFGLFIHLLKKKETKQNEKNRKNSKK